MSHTHYAISTSCIDCPKCQAVCPAPGAIVRGRPVQVNPELCVGCGYCVAACPFGFITVHVVTPPTPAPDQALAVSLAPVVDEPTTVVDEPTPAPVTPKPTRPKRRNRQ